MFKMLKTKVNSIIFGGCLTYKSALRIFVWALKVPFFVPKSGQFGKSAPLYVPKNGILDAGTKILRSLL